MLSTRLAAIAATCLALAPAVLAASPTPPAPSQLDVERTSSGATVTWTGPNGLYFQVYRDDLLLGVTKGGQYADPEAPATRALYVVRAAYGNSGPWGEPGATALPTVGCEVVSTSTSWNPPYLHVTVHEECFGTTSLRNLTWTAPQG